MSQVHNTIFISYRRSVASFIARAIFGDLRHHGYDVFMDVESIDSGTFDTIILNQIAARAHFLLILTPGTLERCAEPGDWLRREIEEALRLNRNIVPLFINNFDISTGKDYLTGTLSEIPRFNGVTVPHEYFEAAMERLRTRFLKLPVTAELVSTPAADRRVVEQKIEELTQQPNPTKKDLSAEEYFNQAYRKRKNGDTSGAIEDYTRAIQLKPDYATAYLNRGAARYVQGDISAAIQDYDRAIQLKPDYADAYLNQGAAHSAQGDLSTAIQDYDRAIQLKPDLATAFYNRGLTRYYQGDMKAAIQDYSRAIQLKPDYATAYNNRGEAYFSIKEYAAAFEDFQETTVWQPKDLMALAGLAITHHVLGKEQEALRIWREEMLPNGDAYRDADWVGKEFNWLPELVEEARKLIAKL
jgi:tetratricopeptide (TPR) repeat protein